MDDRKKVKQCYISVEMHALPNPNHAVRRGPSIAFACCEHDSVSEGNDKDKKLNERLNVTALNVVLEFNNLFFKFFKADLLVFYHEVDLQR